MGGTGVEFGTLDAFLNRRGFIMATHQWDDPAETESLNIQRENVTHSSLQGGRRWAQRTEGSVVLSVF